jgi:hypothetical protein
MKNWQAPTHKLLISITGEVVKDYMRFDFGRQTKSNALSVIVDAAQGLSLLAVFCPDIYGMAMGDRDVKAVIESDRHIYLWWD